MLRATVMAKEKEMKDEKEQERQVSRFALSYSILNRR